VRSVDPLDLHFKLVSEKVLSEQVCQSRNYVESEIWLLPQTCNLPLLQARIMRCGP
jgi:hypothetical protein